MLGISTASFYPLETEAALKFLGENGVSCAEIFFNSERELKPAFISLLYDIKENYGIRISAIHPLSSFAEPYLIFSEYLRRFEDTRNSYRRYYEIAAELGAKTINLHGDRPNGNLSVEEYCERYLLLKNDAAEFKVTLNQENVNGYRSADPEFLAEMRQFLQDDVCFTLDIKQCIRAGYTPGMIMDSMGNQISHVHISDHSSHGDCLLPLNGGFDFSLFFNTLKQNGYAGDYMIEVYQNAYRNYSEIIDSWKNISFA